MKKTILTILLSTIILIGVTGCNKEKELNEISIKELNNINDKIITYFQENGVNSYDNYSYNYVDEENKLVIVGLVDNSKEQQEWFKNNIVNSKYIKFEQGNHATTSENYSSYESISILNSNKADIKFLVKFNETLYAKSNKIIDYAGKTESVGTIDKLIPDNYIPKLNGETNSSSILNALVFDVSEKSLVLFYNNEYILFEKIN